MSDDKDSLAEIVDAAKKRCDLAEAGDTLAAKDVLEQAAVGLRDVLKDHRPDPERLVYLKFLEKALSQINQDVSPDKALGLWGGGRPHSISDSRSVDIFIAVGLEYNRILAKKNKYPSPVKSAIEYVSTQYGIGRGAVRKAWTKFGSLNGWRHAYQELEKSPPL